MNCVVTAGPTFEPLDDVRRLTNFSTGRLGTELANHLAAHGHQVTLLIGEQATHRGERHAQTVEVFTTTADLRERLKKLSAGRVDGVFHAAAVSDFAFGQIWTRSAKGEMTPLQCGKFTTRDGTLLAELTPTPKIIAELRGWYPQARLAGWKFEVEGGRAEVVERAERQLAECRTDLCVVNGRAYGPGFGLVTGRGKCAHVPDMAALFGALEKFARPG